MSKLERIEKGNGLLIDIELEECIPVFTDGTESWALCEAGYHRIDS